MPTNPSGNPRPNPFQSGNVPPTMVRRVKKTGPGAEKNLFAPAVCLILISALWTLILLGYLVVDISNLATGREIVPGNEFAARLGNGGIMLFRGAFYLIFFGYAGFLTYGSVEMLRRQNFALARVTGIMACVPLCTPCAVLGIPFGIWILIVLTDSKVRDRFLS